MRWLFIALIVISFVASAVVYPDAPDEVPTHWDLAGEVDSYSSKAFGLFLMPCLLVLFFIMYWGIPKITVFRKNFRDSMRQYTVVITALFVFILVLQAAILLASSGHAVDVGMFVIIAIAGLFFIIGHAMPGMKRNFFMGIRTPWTLSSDKVWKQTHHVGGIVFRVIALVMVLSIAMGDLKMYVLLASVLAGVSGLMVYSYVLFRRYGGKMR